MKIWAKLIIDGRNIRDTLLDDKRTLTYDNFEEMLRDIAYALDIPTPLSLRIYFNDFKQFNVHKFKANDFVETINFDWLEIENY